MHRVGFVLVAIPGRPSQSLHDLLRQPAIPAFGIGAARAFSGIGNGRPGVRISGQSETESPDHCPPQFGLVPKRDDDLGFRRGSDELTEAHS